MTRAQPVEQVRPEYGPEFDRMLTASHVFWGHVTLAATDDDPVVFVDLMMQDPRLALRTLTLAGTLRRFRRARLVALVGPDDAWASRVWQYYDKPRMRAWAQAHGAVEILDVADTVTRLSDGTLEFTVTGRRVVVDTRATLGDQAQVVAATLLRVGRIPRSSDAVPADDAAGQAARGRLTAAFYDALFAGVPAAALVTSHVDYTPWGLAVDAARRHDVPVVHAQATGGLKAYALFPEADPAGMGFRRSLTHQIAAEMETVWRHRDVVAPAAERTAWRSKGNFGRPSWWRGGGELSRLDLRSDTERSVLREPTLHELGLRADRPVVAVFNHAVSDAVGGNHEAFAGLADWLTRTAAFAADHDSVSWLFLDHPSQARYDRTRLFEALAAQHAGRPHLAFRQSLELTKNALFSVVDLAVTVRGSVGNEYPAYGIPSLQAGWSEWSHCGLGVVAQTPDEFWARLTEHLAALRDGAPLLTPEQHHRARLWLWAYRSGHDVATPLVPHWELGMAGELFRSLTVAMYHVESDADPALVALRRLWARREPVLTRVDFRAPSADVAAALGVESESGFRPSDDRMATTHDPTPRPVRSPLRVASGQHPVLRLVDGFVRGAAVVGRAAGSHSLLVLDLGVTRGRFALELELEADDESDASWRQRSELPGDPAGQERHLVVQVGNEHRAVCVPADPGDGRRRLAQLRVDAPHEADHGLLLVRLRGVPASTDALPLALVGVRINALTLSPIG